MRSKKVTQKSFDFINLCVKIISSAATLVPFLATLSFVKKDMSPNMIYVIDNPILFQLVCLGIAYSATGHLNASILGTFLALSLYTMTMDTKDEISRYTFSLQALVGMQAGEAIQDMKKIAPSLDVVKVKEIDKYQVILDTLQLQVDEHDNVIDYWQT